MMRIILSALLFPIISVLHAESNILKDPSFETEETAHLRMAKFRWIQTTKELKPIMKGELKSYRTTVIARTGKSSMCFENLDPIPINE